MKTPRRTGRNVSYQNFTDHARLALAIANQLARERSFGEVGPEHILLALLRRPDTIVLGPSEKLDPLRERFERRVATGGSGGIAGKLPVSKAGKDVLNRAIEECQRLGTRRPARRTCSWDSWRCRPVLP
jgi:ATP-dependent Clp protease ATP-binding subunit ClpA